MQHYHDGKLLKKAFMAWKVHQHVVTTGSLDVRGITTQLAEVMWLIWLTETSPSAASDLPPCRGTSQTTRRGLSPVLKPSPYVLSASCFVSIWMVVWSFISPVCTFSPQEGSAGMEGNCRSACWGQARGAARRKPLPALPSTQGYTRQSRTMMAITLFVPSLTASCICEGVSWLERSNSTCSVVAPPAGGSSHHGSEVHESR